AHVVTDLAASGIRVSLFINPDEAQVQAAYATGAQAIEIHTGSFCESKGAKRARELKRIQKAAKLAHGLGLEVHAGHG
ncbi:pyridoxine 5'-phosphate synthase, partial [Parvimonas micra]|uniref:pyridoxine 5'-phosphate synthase n=1 Tax=Parvimonas micra TaxID=33033 RepID=UPI002B47577F